MKRRSLVRKLELLARGKFFLQKKDKNELKTPNSDQRAAFDSHCTVFVSALLVFFVCALVGGGVFNG